MILICISLMDNDVEDFLRVSAICASYSEQPARVLARVLLGRLVSMVLPMF